MSTVRPVVRFNIVRKPTKRRCLGQRSGRQVAVVSPTDVMSDVSDESNKDGDDAGFCGEPFADNGELLSSLSPLLTSMKLFGLYFHRQERHQRPTTDDPEWNSEKRSQPIIPGLRAYATVALILVWLNAVRLFSLFREGDRFGSFLLIKTMTFAGLNLAAIMYTAYYYASHSGKLYKVLGTLPVTRDCVIGVRRVAVAITAIMWLSTVINLTILASIHFTNITYKLLSLYNL